ncbi:hypothetical protein EYR40_007293 [Pleurotus pulmonarius]|nr:hypothetical protein EYR36_003426 [Pleurotus pulmonarius]KAF4577541.1 hypothetical protein EYR36_005531 [Pleurotus pulmonarius]KAF4580682.1 hypothetical protein EYR40_003081 [Pleurotus pulmonarius]KAF4600182.1 hypothetical protein EYR40_007293 [Pleurotus pulmonarius]
MAKSANSGSQKKGRGRKTWAKGSKLEFLESFKEEYLATADTGGLYTKITTQFINKYGYDLPHDEDASDTPPIIVNLANLPYDEQETEQERRDKIYDSLRLKIGNWLRHKYKRKQTDQDMVAELLNTMSRLAAVRPRRRNAMNLYWAENYATSIKKLFDAHWKKVKSTVPSELRMSMCADFVRAKYEDETEEFRKALELRADAEYTQALDEYNKRDALNGSPESYAHAWNEAENFLPVFVDAVAKKFGMSVSLLLVGPLAAEGGNITMRSIHSHNVGAMTKLMWPEYDNSGFTSMQASLVRYGEAVFSPEERRRRLGLDSEPNLTEPMQLMDGPYQPPHVPDPELFAGHATPQHLGPDLPPNQGIEHFIQAHMPNTGFTELLEGDWTQDMQFWNNAPNIFDPELEPPAEATTIAGDTSSAITLSPPPTPLPDSPLAQPALNDKENLTPTGEKRALDQEPEDSSKRTRRQSKLPTHLEDAGYVAPSKGKRKPTVKPPRKPTAKQTATKRASKKK